MISRANKPPPRIIVSADDFGLTEAVNLGILDCCAAGAVSSVSVLAAGKAFRSGAARLREFPAVSIGVHLCLNDETPLSQPGELSDLLRNGRLPSYRDLAYRLLTGRVSGKEVYGEWKRQIEAVLASGLSPDHLDTHNHIHLYPALFRLLTHLAEEYDIPAVRLPGWRCAAQEPRVSGAAKLLLSASSPKKKEELSLRGLGYPDSTLGFFRPGTLTTGTLKLWAAAARPGEVTEIITHPGRGTSMDTERYAGWRYDWQAERDALLAFSAAGGWQNAGAVLCGYGETREAAGPSLISAADIKGISVVIPAYNEKENISKTLAITKRYLKAHASDYEIIVVDDMSTDGTGAEAERLLGGGEGRVVRPVKKAGYGSALRAGFDAAKKDLILYFDADYPVNIRHMAEAFLLSAKFDFVIGRRTNCWSEGLVRWTYSRVYKALVRLVFGLRVSDINFAFKLFRTSAWRALRVRSDGSFVDAELLIEATRAGFSMTEIPIPLLPRTFGSSQLANFRNIAQIFSELGARAFRGREGI